MQDPNVTTRVECTCGTSHDVTGWAEYEARTASDPGFVFAEVYSIADNRVGMLDRCVAPCGAIFSRPALEDALLEALAVPGVVNYPDLPPYADDGMPF